MTRRPPVSLASALTAALPVVLGLPAVLGVAAAVGVAGGPAASPGPQPAEARVPVVGADEPAALAAVQALLDRRAAAVAAGDRGGWLATVDPEAPAAFREAQARLFDGLRSLPGATYRLEATLAGTGDLAPGIAHRYPHAEVLLPETRQFLRLPAYDDRDQVENLWWTYVRRSGEWFVAADADLEPLGLQSARGLWDGGPLASATRPGVVVLHDAGQAGRADALADLTRQALDTFASRWDRPWSGSVVVVLARSTDELERILQATVDLDKFVAFVSYSAVRDSGWEATAPRLYVQDANLASYSTRDQVEILVHELVHAATAPLAGPLIPSWLHEGLAEWVAGGRPVVRRPPPALPALPRDHQFGAGSQQDIVAAYRASARVAALLTGHHPDAPVALFEQLGALRVAPGDMDHHVHLRLP